MRYGLTKKMTFLLYEYHFNSNGAIEKDLCNIIHELERQDWHDLRCNYEECLQALHNIPTNRDTPLYSWVKDCNHFIQYLEYLPVEIAEEQAERAIARSEALSDYIYENGYDEVMRHGFSF